MSQYKFVPNQLGKEAFNMASEYAGDLMPAILQKAMGKENFDKYMIAQDPLYDGRESGDINIMLNPGETNPNLKRFESIGTLYKLG